MTGPITRHRDPWPGCRRTVLHRLMETYQQSDPFKFLIYAELADAEIGPVG